MVEHLFCNQGMAVRFCHGAPNFAGIQAIGQSHKLGSEVSNTSSATKFCKCQQEKDTIEGFFEELTIVKQREARILSKK